MLAHVKKFAKGYSAGVAALAVGPFAANIVVIIVWALSLVHIPIPDNVQAALTYVVTALASGGAAAAVSNSQ